MSLLFKFGETSAFVRSLGMSAIALREVDEPDARVRVVVAWCYIDRTCPVRKWQLITNERLVEPPRLTTLLKPLIWRVSGAP